jgi:cytoskeletal protein CcmA (bactofilin family)
MRLECDLYVDGHFEGIINSDKTVTIGKNGRIEGEIRTRRLIVQGVAEGSIDAERIEIKSAGRISGMIASNELVIEPKAVFEGESRIKALNGNSAEKLEYFKEDQEELPESQ